MMKLVLSLVSFILCLGVQADDKHIEKFEGLWKKSSGTNSFIELFEEGGKLKGTFLYGKISEPTDVRLYYTSKKNDIVTYSGRTGGKDFKLKMDVTQDEPCLRAVFSDSSLSGDLSVGGEGECTPFYYRYYKNREGSWQGGGHQITLSENANGKDFSLEIRTQNGLKKTATVGSDKAEWKSFTVDDPNNSKSRRTYYRITAFMGSDWARPKTVALNARKKVDTTQFGSRQVPYVWKKTHRFQGGKHIGTTRHWAYRTEPWSQSSSTGWKDLYDMTELKPR